MLKKFNDQMLCAQEQLSVLVKAAGKGANVNLQVIRGGKEQSLTATLGETDAPQGARRSSRSTACPASRSRCRISTRRSRMPSRID